MRYHLFELKAHWKKSGEFWLWAVVQYKYAVGLINVVRTSPRGRARSTHVAMIKKLPSIFSLASPGRRPVCRCVYGSHVRIQKLGLFEEIVVYIRKNTKLSFYCSLEILCVGFYWIESFVEQLRVCETLPVEKPFQLLLLLVPFDIWYDGAVLLNIFTEPPICVKPHLF